MIGQPELCFVDTHGRRLAFGAPVSGLDWIGDHAWFSLGDGRVEAMASDGSGKTVRVHDGAILSAAIHPDGVSLITGGDDGLVIRTAADGGVTPLGTFDGKWVDHLATSRKSGLIVAAVGKEAVVWQKASAQPSHRFVLPSTIGGLALDDNGKRLCAAHYSGATLFYAASADSTPVGLAWAGSHIGCTIAPTGRFVVTSVQETGLHGWQLPAKSDLAMSGYAGKTRSFSWNRSGKWLATSGDKQAILWPFAAKNGPIGKSPQLLAPANSLVTRVAFHPRDEVLAVGYADGAVAIAQLADEAVLPIQDADGSAITALAWRDDGKLLAWGSEDGLGGLLDMRVRA
jgi:WD40 repeat protein